MPTPVVVSLGDTTPWSPVTTPVVPLAPVRSELESFSMTDFRADLATIQVPTLIVHGKADKTVPLDASGKRTAAMLPFADFKVYDDAPHALVITHKDQFNADLLAFLSMTESRSRPVQHPSMDSTAPIQSTSWH